MAGDATVNLENARTPSVVFQRTEITWPGVHDGAARSALFDRLVARLHADSGRLETEFSGRTTGIEFTGSGRVGRVDKVEGSPFDVKLETRLGDARVHLDATVHADATGPVGTATLRVAGPDISLPVQALGLKVPVSGPYDLSGKVVRNAGAPLGVTARLEIASLAASLSGEIAATDFRPGNWFSYVPEANLSATASGGDIAVWLDAFGFDVPLKGPFKAQTSLMNSQLDGVVEIQGKHSRLQIEGGASLGPGASPGAPISFADFHGTADLSGTDGDTLAAWLGADSLHLGPYEGRLELQDDSLRGSVEAYCGKDACSWMVTPG